MVVPNYDHHKSDHDNSIYINGYADHKNTGDHQDDGCFIANNMGVDTPTTTVQRRS